MLHLQLPTTLEPALAMLLIQRMTIRATTVQMTNLVILMMG